MASRVMEKTIQLQQPPPPPPPPHEALKCPRCDSSNTKFCYYNNYSLSQPRHFCKACKRYWTRGGTLRNVPVGGGCRKNKRVKRPPITSSNAPATQSQVNHHHHTNPNPNNNNNNNHDHQNQIPSSSTTTNSNHHLNPLFYGLIAPHQNPNNYPRFDTTTTRVSSVNENHLVSGGYGTLIQPQHMNINASESLSYSPLGTAGGSNLNFGSYNNNSFMYGAGGGSTCSAPSTMASLLASTFNQQHQRIMGGFANYDHDGMMSSSNNLVIKDLKVENNSQNKIMDWNNSNNNFHGGQNKSDHYDQIDEAAVVSTSSDPNSILWDAEGGGGGWLDQTNNNNIGSTSVPSLI